LDPKVLPQIPVSPSTEEEDNISQESLYRENDGDCEGVSNTSSDEEEGDEAEDRRGEGEGSERVSSEVRALWAWETMMLDIRFTSC
jgi:hypothetical protein